MTHAAALIMLIPWAALVAWGSWGLFWMAVEIRRLRRGDSR